MKYYLVSFVVLVAVLLGHIFGSSEGWYMNVPFYDVFMHLLGGLGVGFALVAVISKRGLEPRGHFKLILLGVFIFGFAWEAFEAYFNIAGYEVWTRPYFADTTKDLINDMLGGCVAFMIGIWTHKQHINK